MADIVLKVAGMTCQHCKMSVEKALKGLPGVKSASVDLAAGQAKVEYTPGQVDLGKMETAVEEAGYEVVH